MLLNSGHGAAMAWWIFCIITIGNFDGKPAMVAP